MLALEEHIVTEAESSDPCVTNSMEKASNDNQDTTTPPPTVKNAATGLYANRPRPRRWSDEDSTDDEGEFRTISGGTSSDGGACDNSDAASLASGVATSPNLPSMRSNLSTGAKVWTPDAARIPQEVPGDAEARLLDVINSSKSALNTCSFINSIETRESQSGWMLIASMQCLHPQQIMFTLTLLQQALLRAAEQSHDVYVVGYEAVPFTQMYGGLGFRAQLAIVEDEELVCWELISQGVCKRGCACRWDHPQSQKTVDVFVTNTQLGAPYQQ